MERKVLVWTDEWGMVCNVLRVENLTEEPFNMLMPHWGKCSKNMVQSDCWTRGKMGRSLELTAPYLLERVQQRGHDHIHSPGLCCWCWSRAALLTSARRVRCQRRTRPTGSCRGSCPAAWLPLEPDEAQVTLTVNNSLLVQSNWKETSTKDSN